MSDRGGLTPYSSKVPIDVGTSTYIVILEAEDCGAGYALPTVDRFCILISILRGLKKCIEKCMVLYRSPSTRARRLAAARPRRRRYAAISKLGHAAREHVTRAARRLPRLFFPSVHLCVVSYPSSLLPYYLVEPVTIMSTRAVIPVLVAFMLLTGVCNTLLTKFQVRLIDSPTKRIDLTRG